MLWCSSGRGVGDGPRRLFPGPEFGFLQNFNEDWEDVGVDYRLGRNKKTIRHTAEVEPFLLKDTVSNVWLYFFGFLNLKPNTLPINTY